MWKDGVCCIYRVEEGQRSSLHSWNSWIVCTVHTNFHITLFPALRLILPLQSLNYEDNEQKWLETVTNWGIIISFMKLTYKHE